ncbi:MAG TPA: cupredoxin domain-containing protein [Desulfobacteria bacterium]|nr:cupredoxin domain-containing protein [Desulfobacteria bacterium]
MKKPALLMAPVAFLLALGLTACGTSASTTASSQNQPTPQPAQATQTSQPAHQANVAMTILPGTKLGPDGKKHDIFSPADITVVQGVPTTVTVYNYDDGGHSFAAKDLGLNVQIPGSTKKGVPSVTTFTVKATKAGDFHWLCTVKCDGDANGWAMANNGYMAGTVHVLAQQPQHDTFALTIKPGLKLGPDNKLHDSFSPTDLTVTKGVPMDVTVYNYDDGDHSFTAKDLGLDVKIPGGNKNGTPSVTTFTIKPTKTGDFTWLCDIQCDGEAHGWAMSNKGYMMGTVHVK